MPPAGLTVLHVPGVISDWALTPLHTLECSQVSQVGVVVMDESVPQPVANGWDSDQSAADRKGGDNFPPHNDSHQPLKLL